MANYVPLLERIELSVGNNVEEVMFHVREHVWPLYVDPLRLKSVGEREYVRIDDHTSASGMDGRSSKKQELWDIDDRALKEFHHISKGSKPIIPLPFWNLEISKGCPVFHYFEGFKDYRYRCHLNDLYVDPNEVPPLAKPIPEGAVCKLETDWNLQSLQQAFIAMAEKGWVTPKAPYAVPKRFTNSKSREVVEAETEMFDWLESQTLLSQVCGKFSVQKSYVSIHFLHKGRPLRKEFYRSGVKPTQRKVIDEAHNLLKSYQP
jgi:hypothetical protein